MKINEKLVVRNNPPKKHWVIGSNFQERMLGGGYKMDQKQNYTEFLRDDFNFGHHI